jgi:hypothetical protein
VALGIAAIAFGGARIAREVAAASRVEGITEEPYAPSPSAAPIFCLGYREAAADWMSLRLTGYFGGSDSTARGITALVEALVALDPKYYHAYEYGARAMTMAAHDVDQSTYFAAIHVLERGMTEFRDDWKLPYLAGQIYTQDLETKDPETRRKWDEAGTLLVESAIRKPGAPAHAAEWAAVMRTKLGQHERAVEGLREMLLVTTDDKARERLIDRLAKLENADAAELAAELFEARHKFEDAWRRERPFVPASMYVLLGAPLGPSFDLGALATGGREIVGSEELQKLDPLD